jgi:hypothetical protein
MIHVLQPGIASRFGPGVGDTWRCSTSARRLVGVVVLGLFVIRGLGLLAAAPVLDHLFPAAVQIGVSNSITAIGKFEPWPPKVWTDSSGLLLVPTTNVGIFQIEVRSNTPVGPHFVRLFNAEGASSPRFLILTRDPQITEIEPNDLFTQPQRVDRLPAVINGRLEKAGDVDSFAVELQAGQTLIASVEAYTLQSPLDAVLRLVDSRGVRLAQNHDDGRTLDPRLVWTAKVSGTFILQLFGFDYPAGSEIRFAGNAKCVYRLHISAGPTLSHAMPLGVRRGASTKLQLSGWNFLPSTPREWEVDGAKLEPVTSEMSVLPSGFETPLILPVGDGPEFVESEPNNSQTNANKLEIPAAVSGTIGGADDVDSFAFSAREGDLLWLEVQSAYFGFPLDAWLAIEDSSGKELVRNDDGNSSDPVLEWKVPAGTNFFASVGGLLHRGGPESLYRLSISRPKPTVSATVADDVFTLETGKTNEVKLTITRKFGHANKLRASVRGLPQGVTVQLPEILDKGGDFTLKLIAAPDAIPVSGPFRIAVSEMTSGREWLAHHDLVSAGENNGVPQGFKHLAIESIDQLWLSLREPAQKKDEKPSK